jgi:hypothetical protein
MISVWFRSKIAAKRLIANKRLICFGKRRTRNAVGSLSLCYLLLSEVSVYANNNQCQNADNETWNVFYGIAALCGIALLTHGWYFLMSEPTNGYQPPVSERMLRLTRGFISLIAGFLVGGYALRNLDPIFSENASVSHGISCASVQPYGRAEDVRVSAIVMATFSLAEERAI